jgi:hypothetical protein
LTKAEIIAKVKVRVDEDDIDSDFLDDAFDSIYFKVAGETKTFWKWLQGSATFSTVSGTANYTISTIASDIDDIYEIYHEDNQLRPIVRREFDQAVPDPTATGTPTYYTEWGGSIMLYPIPNETKTITVKYRKKITAIEDADTPLVPEKDQEVLILGIMMMYYERDENDDYYSSKVSEFNVFLRDMISRNESELDKNYRIKLSKNAKAFQDWDYQG